MQPATQSVWLETHETRGTWEVIKEWPQTLRTEQVCLQAIRDVGILLPLTDNAS